VGETGAADCTGYSEWDEKEIVMAQFTGRLGAVSFAGQDDLSVAEGGENRILANKWSADAARDIHDVTPFNPTGNAKQHLGGLYMLSGTIEGFLDNTAAADLSHMSSDEAPAGFVLTAYTGYTYTFDGLLSNFSVDIDVQGPSTWSASFTSSGAIAVALA
jgi:hypothetical protein